MHLFASARISLKSVKNSTPSPGSGYKKCSSVLGFLKSVDIPF